MPKKIPRSKIYVITGPTASGKSEYAVRLAKKYDGEIISADSRQVYKDLNIGTGKVSGKWMTLPRMSLRGGSASDRRSNLNSVERRLLRSDALARNDTQRIFVYKGVSHYCIDFVSPRRQYSVAEFKRHAEKALRDILARGKTPIICGGTGQFVDSLILGQHIPEVLPDPSFRKLMEKKSTAQLFAMLQKKDPARAASIDSRNPRRLIRALEIIHATGKPVPLAKKGNPFATKGLPFFGTEYNVKIIYLNPPRDELYKKIEKRLKQRLKQSMVTEIKKLHKKGITWKRMDDLGLEYRYISRYLRGQLSYDEMYTKLLSEIKHYAKRQQTWFKKYTPYTKTPRL